MKKIIALLVCAAMIFTLAATVFATPAEVTWEDYQQYLLDTAGKNAPNKAEFAAQVEAITSWEDIDLNAIPWNQFFTTLGLSTWEEFQQGIVKELAVINESAGSDDGPAAAPAEEAPAAEGESPEGESPEGESPEGESPAEGAPVEEAPAADAAAPAEGESPAGESPAGEAPAEDAVSEATEEAAPAAEGESPEGESPTGEAPAEDAVSEATEEAAPAAEGESPEGESAEGESPEGESPAGEAPAEDAAAPAEGESAAGESAEGESAEGDSAAAAPAEEIVYPEFDVDFTPYSSEENYTVYKVTMTMQAGYQNYSEYEGGGVMTIHSGVGFLDPFGEGYYHAGIMYPESFAAPEAIYVSDWMDANYGCDLFCIYHTNAGDIYAWDGIYGANSKDLSNYMSGDEALTPEQVNGTTPTRSDNLINIVAGGTGMFKGAYGVLIGTTSGSGIYDTVGALTLPQSLYKYMTGYIVVPDDCETAALYEVTQELSEDHSALQVRSTEYVMVPLTLRMQLGNIEEDTKDGRGTGVLVPYNADNVLVDYVDCPAAANYDIHNYVNDNWLAAYGEPEFMTIHIDDGMVSGDVYAYKFSYATILDSSSDFAQTGGEKAVFILMVDGTDDFAGITGMLGGFDAICDPEGWGYDFANDFPVQHQTWAEGVMKVPAESMAAIYGNTPIMD